MCDREHEATDRTLRDQQVTATRASKEREETRARFDRKDRKAPPVDDDTGDALFGYANERIKA